MQLAILSLVIGLVESLIPPSFSPITAVGCGQKISSTNISMTVKKLQPMNKRGCFILLEGLDRSGKSTQAKILADSLRSAVGKPESVTVMKFPDRSGPIGSFIGSYLCGKRELDDTSCHLLFSAERWEMAEKIRKIIRSGNHIVCDRYAYSGVSFTKAKGSRSLEWCKGTDRGLPKPDIGERMYITG